MENPGVATAGLRRVFIFERICSTSDSHNTADIELVDLDRDGDLDVIAGNNNTCNRCWLFDSSKGIFFRGIRDYLFGSSLFAEPVLGLQVVYSVFLLYFTVQ